MIITNTLMMTTKSLCDFISSIRSVTLRRGYGACNCLLRWYQELVHCVLNEPNKCASIAELLQIQFEPNYLHVVKQYRSGLNWFGCKAEQDHVILTLLGQCRAVIERQKLRDCLLSTISLLTI